MKCLSCEAVMVEDDCSFGCVQTVEECIQILQHQMNEMQIVINAHSASLHDLNMIREGLSELESNLGASLDDFDTGTDAEGNDL